MNGHTTTIVDDRHEITTTVRRHRVRLDVDRTELGAIVCALCLLAADEGQLAQNRTLARELLWRVVDAASGPSRTIDRRTPPEVTS